ncbi:MAG: hypothetical protein BA863_06230 [Desulfovibrio sp. S3730MH75]|nr:MAG: hypothetical protein BA863_06230 [Desulfovibrio sp. S3730MH75]
MAVSHKGTFVPSDNAVTSTVGGKKSCSWFVLSPHKAAFATHASRDNSGNGKLERYADFTSTAIFTDANGHADSHADTKKGRPGISGPAPLKDKHLKSLTKQDHLLRLDKVLCLETIEIDTTRHSSGVPFGHMVTGIDRLVHERCHKLALHVEDIQPYMRLCRQTEVDQRYRIERVRIVLRKAKHVRGPILVEREPVTRVEDISTLTGSGHDIGT